VTESTNLRLKNTALVTALTMIVMTGLEVEIVIETENEKETANIAIATAAEYPRKSKTKSTNPFLLLQLMKCVPLRGNTLLVVLKSKGLAKAAKAPLKK
jgi:hypothetical protein